MAKIINDKYYTPEYLAEYCVKKTKEIIGEENITEWLEPSGGNGVFLDYLPFGTYSCDIEPEDDRIKKQDYLELNLEYKQGRCIIGNPPFGNRNNLSISFYKKSITLGDYIAFILPISQLNNNIKMYEFNLVYSEDLKMIEYSDRNIHCCFNIYKRNEDNSYNKKINYKLSDVEIKEDITSSNPKRDRKILKDYFNYDLRICYWGSATGKESLYPRQYAHEFCIKINNEKYKQKIISLIKNANWKEMYPSVATPALYQWQVYKYLKEQIPELE